MDVSQVAEQLKLKLEENGIKNISESFYEHQPGTHGCGLKFTYIFNQDVDGHRISPYQDPLPDTEYADVIMHARNAAYSNYRLLQSLFTSKNEKITNKERCKRICQNIEQYIRSMLKTIEPDAFCSCRINECDIFDVTIRVDVYMQAND